ncbi:Transcriptional-regulating factor 1 [Merluccius polli]|uniref:Transcriptional-regulating factor 1 n=1 Tax=Merluccius polli TaxID=89951 RepID=A0AA47NN78_MERPO|nr:Transcriptional-regulating factor 1 [Merluccius polli]
MEDPSTSQQANARPPHHHPPPNHFNLTRLQSPRPGYTSSTYKPPPDPLLEPTGSRTEQPPQSSSSFPTSSSSWRGGEDVAAGRVLQRVGRNAVNEDADVAGVGPGEHYSHAWSDGAKEPWDGRLGSCGSSASEFYGKDDYCRYADRVFHERSGSGNNVESERDARDSFDMVFLNDGDKQPGYSRSDSFEVKYETVYVKDANSDCYGNHNVFYNRDTFRQGSVDEASSDGQCGLSDRYLDRVEDPASSQSSSGGRSSQVPHTGLDWRGGEGGDFQGLAPVLKPQLSNGRYPQKLDSFSEAFQPYRRRGILAGPDVDPAGRLGRFEAGRGECVGWTADAAGQGCPYGPSLDSYVPTHSSYPSLPSLPSLPSPPHPSQLMPSVLSPPPTPLPPSSLSPSQVDCWHTFGTSTGHPILREGETVGTIQFFPSHIPSRPCPTGGIWKLPGLPHCYPQQSCDPRAIAEGNLRTNHGDVVHGPSEHHGVLMAPEPSFINCSPLTPSPHTPSFPTPPPLHPSRPLNLSFRPAHPVSFHQRKEGRITSCKPQAQENGTPSTYRGTPFPSMLHCREDGQRRGHYTPRPILNPNRQGSGIYFVVASVSRSPQEMVRGGEVEEQQFLEAPCINIGPDFQAELPTCSPEGEESPCPTEEASSREQLLWKPFAMLEESVAVQCHVEMLRSMCNSSCLPGGGANTELALHCLHHCHGDTMATLEMLLFSLPTATGDYHYSGSDQWTDKERTVFSEGLRTLGKDFSLIQNMVKTKSVRQCVEFYYLGKRLVDLQRRQTDRHREEEAAGAIDQQVASAPQPIRSLLGPEKAVPVTPLSTFFPCKMCGKMFYKIKSRNAHMKIHRQPQEDWSERRLQTQFLAHRLNVPHSLPPNLGSSLLLHQASPQAYPFQSLSLPSNNNDNNNSHPDSVLNSFEVNNNSGCGGGGVAHGSDMRIKNGISTLTAFGNMSETNPHAVSGGDVSDSSAANQRGPPTVQSPVPQSWTLWME